MAPEASHTLWLRRLILLALAFALLRNLLPPNAFTATVLIFDYEFGLVRRGLIGELGNLWWGETVSKGEVFAAAALMTVAGILAFVALAWRQLAGREAGLRLLLVIVTSFAFDAMISATGYIDLAILALLSLAILTPPTGAAGLLARTVAATLAVFMHEVALPYIAVFLVFDLWHARPRLSAALPFVAGVAAFALLIVAGDLPPDQTAAYIAHIEAKSEFTAEPEATVVMERTLSDNLAMMAEKRWMLDYRTWAIFDGIPLLFLAIWVAVWNFRLLPPERRGMTRLLMLGAILAPLSLNIIAFDIVRFGAMSVLVGFLCLLTQLRDAPDRWARLEDMLGWPTVVIWLVVNLNLAVNQMNTGDAHEFMVPWVLIEQLGWF